MAEINIPVDGEMEGWRVDSPAAAEWALSRIAEERSNAARIMEAAEGMIEYYERQIAKAKEDLAGRESFWLGKLRVWFEDQPKRELKASWAVDLPSGKLSLSKYGKFEFKRDNAALTKWLMANAGEFIVIKPEPDWTELKKHISPTLSGAVCLTATGEVIDGISFVETEPQLQVKLV